jgi:hypothetical protein
MRERMPLAAEIEMLSMIDFAGPARNDASGAPKTNNLNKVLKIRAEAAIRSKGRAGEIARILAMFACTGRMLSQHRVLTD